MKNVPDADRIVVGGAFLDPGRHLEFLTVQSAFLDEIPRTAPDCAEDLYQVLPVVLRIAEAWQNGRDPDDDDLTSAEGRIKDWARRWGQGVEWFGFVGAQTLVAVARVQVRNPSLVLTSKLIFGEQNIPFQERKQDSRKARDLILSLNPEWEEIGGQIHIEQVGQWLPVFQDRATLFNQMVEEYKLKLKKEFDAIEERFSTELPPSTSFSRRHVEWTIRHVTMGESIRSIARELARNHNKRYPRNPRSEESFTPTVRSGIDRIGSVLGFARLSAMEQNAQAQNRIQQSSNAPNVVKYQHRPNEPK